jgi:adenylosuccinate synthase
LPSGTRATEAPLLIGPGAVINVEVLLDEISASGVDVDRLSL